MATNKNEKALKVMDVSRPGKSTPPATAKPIIVTNRPILRRDPMMASPDGLDKPTAPDEKVTVSRTAKTLNVITPAESAPATAAPAAAPSAPKAPEVAAVPDTQSDLKMPETTVNGNQEANSKPANTAPKPQKEAPTAAQIISKSEAVQQEAVKPAETQPAPEPTPAPAASAATTPEEKPAEEDPELDDSDEDTGSSTQLAPNQALEQAKRKEEDAKAARQAEEEKIVTSKQFYLPMSVAKERRGLNRVLLILALVLVLALVWADIVLDAGIIHIGGLHALTRFFS